MSISMKKPKARAKTVSVVRYRYDANGRKRTTEIYLGSLPLDLDPEDVREVFAPSKKPKARASIDKEPLTDDDFTLMKAWLIKHGDADAVRRRNARDERTVKATLARMHLNAAGSGDEFDRAAAAIQIAAQAFLDLPSKEGVDKEKRWTEFRGRYLQVNEAIKEFRKSADAAGVMKKKEEH